MNLARVRKSLRITFRGTWERQRKYILSHITRKVISKALSRLTSFPIRFSNPFMNFSKKSEGVGQLEALVAFPRSPVNVVPSVHVTYCTRFVFIESC